MKNYKICPICEGDCLYHYNIPKINQKVKICWECDSIWLDKKETNTENALDYTAYLFQQGLEPTWGEELENIYEYPVYSDD